MLFAATLLAGSSRGKEPLQTPQQLIESSRKASDFSQIGPYRLQATVILNPGISKKVTGQIIVLRDGDLYRSELQLEQYHETRWANGNKLYISRSQQIPLIKTPLLRHLDRLWRPSLLPSDAKVTRMFRQKHNHTELQCFEAIRGEGAKRTSCFDPSTGVMVENGSEEYRELDFLDYATFEQRYFPTRMIFRERDGVALEVKDITISKAEFNRDVLAPPPGIPAMDTCDDPMPPARMKDAVPQIPREELSRFRSANVYLYGIIGTDGAFHNIAVEYSPHPSFTQSAIDAIRQMRYAPAMCGDRAVPMETETLVRYFIR